jgi:hypothetical protein
MPTYTFRNPVSGDVLTKRLSFKDYEAVKAGEKSLVAEDGTELEIVFDPGTVGFVLKDGVSGGWASKALKENQYRRERTAAMTRREKDHVFKSRLVPNYQGKEADKWADVQDHVRTVKGETSAQTYNHLVAREKGVTLT